MPTVVVRDLPPMKPAKAREVVNDPSLVEYTPGGDEPRGPNTFWVSGDEVVISNENPEQPVLVTYRNGRKVRTVRTPDDGCLDLRVEGDRYWILGFEFADGAADGATTPVQDTQEYAAEYVLPKGADRLTEVKRITLPPDSGNAPVTGDLPTTMSSGMTVLWSALTPACSPYPLAAPRSESMAPVPSPTPRPLAARTRPL